jgi:hypothetical protein
MRILQAAIFLVVFISCQDDESINNKVLIQGTYKGQFFRVSPDANYEASNVTISFTSNRFSGESDVIKYPAICNGTYKINGQEIDFLNTCPWTAEFDWSYILNGKFEFTINGNQLEMKKELNGVSDYYKLVLQ